MSNPKILVTGSSGFLGKAVMKKLKNMPEFDSVGIQGRSFWDLTKQKYVDYAISQFEPDYIIHLAAACGGIGINREQPGKFLYDNLSMGMNLIETARKYGRLKKFIMVGTVTHHTVSQKRHLWKCSSPIKNSIIWSPATLSLLICTDLMIILTLKVATLFLP
jgi:nucleoside-diphosphate-sugar epimerase